MHYKKKTHGIYLVAFRLLLRNGNRFLFVRTSQKGTLDLPGGRANCNEGEIPIKEILEREIREELGGKIKYHLGGPVLQYRRYSKSYKMYVLTTAYQADYLGGPIKLSQEHRSYEWLDPKKFEFLPEKFSSAETCQAFVDYFHALK